MKRLFPRNGKIFEWVQGDDSFDGASYKRITQEEADKMVADGEAIMHDHYDEAWSHYLYMPQRKARYPSLEEQMDMQYHDSINGTTLWKDAIKAVKDAIPKVALGYTATPEYAAAKEAGTLTEEQKASSWNLPEVKE